MKSNKLLYLFNGVKTSLVCNKKIFDLHKCEFKI